MRNRNGFQLGTALEFASSSLASFGMDYLLFLLFSQAAGFGAWNLFFSNVAARFFSAMFNYSLNKYLVFHRGGKALRDLPQYFLLAAGILAANSVLLQLLAALGLPAPLAKLLTEAVLFLASFAIQTLWIFAKKTPAGRRAAAHVQG